MAKKKKDRVDHLLGELLKDKKPEEIIGEEGLLKEGSVQYFSHFPGSVLLIWSFG